METFANKGPSSQSYGFSSSHVWIWESAYKESWAPKNWCFWTVVLEKTLESPLTCKGIQPVHPKGNQSWIFIGRTDAEADSPIIWPLDAKDWLISNDPDAGKDWWWEEKGTEDEMVGWHHGLNGHEFAWTLGAGDGQGGLACCSPWGLKESDTTEWLNWIELNPVLPGIGPVSNTSNITANIKASSQLILKRDLWCEFKERRSQGFIFTSGIKHQHLIGLDKSKASLFCEKYIGFSPCRSFLQFLSYVYDPINFCLLKNLDPLI